MTAQAPEAFEPSVWHPELLVGPLRSKRLTVLYGVPGPLRDGMVRRGLMPLLHQRAPARGRGRGRTQVAIRFDGWGALPLAALRARIDDEFRTLWPQGAPPSLAAHLRAIGRQHHAIVLLVLDALERHLLAPEQRPDIERFDAELAECITHDAVPLHVLMVVDELAQQPLQRYARWIANFGDDLVRLPALVGVDATPWSDTNIEAPPDSAHDEITSDGPDVDWSVDLALDLAPPGAQTRAAATAAALPPVPATPAAPEPAARPGVPPVTLSIDPSFDTPVAAVEPMADFPAHAHESLAGERDAARPAPAPLQLPAAAPPAFGAWPEVGAPTPGAARPVPPWLTEADVEAMRRMQQPAPRWPALLGLALYMVVLFAGAWLVARWIIDSNRVDPRPRAAADPPVALNPQPAPVVSAPPPNQATTPTPAQSSTTASGKVTAPVRALTLALPPDAGPVAPIVDELSRRVAAPAGLELRLATGDEPAALVLWRTDALLAARAANAPPLQVVAPLFSEQIQVLVRTDARWDYVREIKGLRLNIGRADGARARTVRALYRQLFDSALPAAQANELDLDRALQQLQLRGSAIDAVVVVSESPILPQLQPALRRQVRELTLDAQQAGAVTALPAFSLSRRTPEDRARLSATTFLVAPGAPPRPHDGALRALAAALCRAQPALQAQGSPLLRGLRQGQQPAVGWPYLLPQPAGAACAPA